MSHTDPPRLATWMLEHLTPRDSNEALAGDLLEDFHTGRSNGWYRRQVVVAIAAGWLRSVFDHRILLFFAATWSMLSPAWLLIFLRLHMQGNLIGHIWRMPWPWSTVCDFGLATAEDLLFVWIGALVYVTLLVSARRAVNFRQLTRGVVMSIVVIVVASACDFAFAVLIAMNTNSTEHGVDWRTLTMLGAIENFRSFDILLRVPYLFGTACALWGSTAKVAKTEGMPG